MTKDFFSKGFYNFTISIKKVYYNYNGSKAFILLEGELGEKRVFHFQGNKYLSRSEIIGAVEQFVSKSRKALGLVDLKKIILNLYEERGIYNSKIDLNLIKVKKEGLLVNSFFCYVKKEKGKVKRCSFSGL